MLLWRRLVRLWAVVRTDARLIWLALRHPRAPGWLKFACLGVLAYLISPIDVIPDVLPVIGVMDDLVIVPLLLRGLFKLLPPDVRADVLARAGHGEASPAGRGRLRT